MSTINGFPSNYFPAWKILNPDQSAQSVREAQTNSRNPSNPPPGNNKILADSLHYNVEKIPSIEVTSSVGALRALDAMRYLTSLTEQIQTPSSQNIDKKSLRAGMQTDALINIRESLKTLSATVTSLLGRDSLNTRSAKSSKPDLVEAVAGRRSPITSVNVVPKQVSADNVLVSDEQPSTHPALGLTGDFVANGFKVSVVSTDTIHTLKDKINYGEDLNHNGKLDGSEDINGTGLPGTIFVHAGEYTPGVYIVKDQNGKGYLNPKEDTNDNGQLDGGTKNTKVVAAIENNRMTLTSLTGGANTIDLQDPDNILLALGFFERNAKGVSVQKEVQYTIVNTLLPPSRDLMVSPKKSVITVDGQTFKSDSNTFIGAVEDATLTVNKASNSQVKISISIDPTDAFNKIKTLFNSFNEAIRKINNELVSTKTFEADTDIQRLRNQLTESQAKIPEASKRNEDMDVYLAKHENQQMIGFTVKSDKGTLQEIAVSNQARSIKDQLASPFKNTPIDLQKRLSSIGIQTAEDSTFSLDEVGLKRALTINGDAVLNLFTDTQTGILPQLKKQLDSVLEKDLGRVDLKAVKIEGLTNIPGVLADKYQKYVETFTFQEKVKNLIAVA